MRAYRIVDKSGVFYIEVFYKIFGYKIWRPFAIKSSDYVYDVGQTSLKKKVWSFRSAQEAGEAADVWMGLKKENYKGYTIQYFIIRDRFGRPEVNYYDSSQEHYEPFVRGIYVPVGRSLIGIKNIIDERIERAEIKLRKKIVVLTKP